MTWYFTHLYDILYISGAFFSFFAMLSQVNMNFFKSGEFNSLIKEHKGEFFTEEKFFEEFESDFSQQVISMQDSLSEPGAVDETIKISENERPKIGPVE